MRFARRLPGTLPLDPSARAAASIFLLPCAVASFVLVWVAMEGVAESEPAASPDTAAAHGVGVDEKEAEGETPDAATSTSDVIEDDSVPDDALGGEVIVVTGTRTETPLSASPVITEVVRRDQIEASGAENVADALRLRPGLWIDRGISGTGVSMQGLSPEYVLILVDGQRQIGRTDGVLDLERFGLADVEQIEVVRGPSSALYGSDALGGVINIIRRDPSEPEAEAQARLDSESASELRGRVAGGRGGWIGSLAGEWRHGPAYDHTPATPDTTISQYDDRQIAGTVGHRRGEWLRLDASADYLQRDLRGVSGGTSGPGIYDRRNLIESASSRVAVRLSGDRTIARLSVGASLYRDQFVNDQRNASAMDQDQETREYLVEVTGQVERRLGDRHRLTGGGEVLHELLDTVRLVDGDADRSRVSAYLQDEWRLGSSYQVLLMPAARVDHDTQFGTHATPRVAARWDITDEVVTRASVGFGFRAPGFKELYLDFENPGVGYVVTGNPDLDPETSQSAQLGAEWRASEHVSLGVSAYWNEIDDLITSVTVPPAEDGTLRFTYGNIGEARTRGGEATVGLRFGHLGLDLGYAFTDARDLVADRDLQNIPRHRASAGARWRDTDRGIDASVDGTVTSERPIYSGEMVTDVDGRFDLRARVARTFEKRYALFVGADNLLDGGDATFDPIPPRTFYVGFAARR
jgi:outer membrane receptor for ferrienterochelin and colicins